MINQVKRAIGSRGARAQEDRNQTRATRIVDLLEKSGVTWFWETDADGQLIYVSSELAGNFGFAAQKMSFCDLVEDSVSGDERDTQRTLAFYLSTRSSFDALVVKGRFNEDLWWSISGRPVTDAYGRFFGFIGFGSDLTEQHRSKIEMDKLATTDALTGLLNRRSITKLASDSLLGAKRRKHCCSLMLLDLDRFKEVNDIHGHLAGDLLLQLVTLRLRQVLQGYEFIGRLGGDEFMVVFPHLSDHVTLSTLSEGLIQSLGEPFDLRGAAVSIGASVGLAISEYDNGSAEDLIHQADLALYAAKHAGRGTFRIYTPDLKREPVEHHALIDDLRLAIETQALEVRYQPSVHLESRSVRGFEALVRWHHPEKGAISPSTFIPLAEAHSLIRPLGELVLRAACRQAASWPDGIKIAVNVSPIQMRDPNLPKLVARILSEEGLPAPRLELEVTESVFLGDDPTVGVVIEQLNELGISLALDDFGTGYSSLSYLYRAPFRKIKIDRCFVKAGGAVELNAAIIQSVVLLARALSMEVTAEGVERDDELAFVTKLGCTNVQGFIFGTPLSSLEADKLVKAECVHATHLITRAERRKVIRGGTLCAGGTDYPVRIRDISRNGAKLEGHFDQPLGTVVDLKLSSDLSIVAEVRWMRSGKIGLNFKQQFDLNRLEEQPSIPKTYTTFMPEYLSTKDNPNNPIGLAKKRLTLRDL